MFLPVDNKEYDSTGLYSYEKGEIDEIRTRRGYFSEEYGIYAGTHKITRGQYDDGGAVIDGEVVDVSEDSDLRIRYLTPYNFLIAAHGSPINNSRFDMPLKTFLNRALEEGNTVNIEELKRAIEALPAREQFGRPM